MDIPVEIKEILDKVILRETGIASDLLIKKSDYVALAQQKISNYVLVNDINQIGNVDTSVSIQKLSCWLP